MNLARLHANSDSSPRSRRLFIERKTSPTRAILASIVTKKPASNVLLNRSFLKKIRSIVQSSLPSILLPREKGTVAETIHARFHWAANFERESCSTPISLSRGKIVLAVFRFYPGAFNKRRDRARWKNQSWNGSCPISRSGRPVAAEWETGKRWSFT